MGGGGVWIGVTVIAWLECLTDEVCNVIVTSAGVGEEEVLCVRLSLKEFEHIVGGGQYVDSFGWRVMPDFDALKLHVAPVMCTGEREFDVLGEVELDEGGEGAVVEGMVEALECFEFGAGMGFGEVIVEPVGEKIDKEVDLVFRGGVGATTREVPDVFSCEVGVALFMDPSAPVDAANGRSDHDCGGHGVRCWNYRRRKRGCVGGVGGWCQRRKRLKSLGGWWMTRIGVRRSVRGSKMQWLARGTVESQGRHCGVVWRGVVCERVGMGMRGLKRAGD